MNIARYCLVAILVIFPYEQVTVAQERSTTGTPGSIAEAWETLVAWVRQTGQAVTLDGDLASALGFPLKKDESQVVQMVARAATDGVTKRQIYVPADGAREYLIFTVDGKSDTKLFLSTRGVVSRRP